MRARVLILTALLVAVMPAAAQADPISGAIAAVLTYFGAVQTAAAVAAWTWGATLTAFAVNTALAAGLSFLSQALLGKSGSVGGGGGQQLQTGGVQPRTFIIGTGAVATPKLAYANTWGAAGKTPNAYLTLVIALSDLPVSGLSQIFVNGSAATYGSGTPDANKGYAIPEFNRAGVDYLWVKFHDGSQTTADSWLVSQFGSDANFPYG
ncbi:MAG: hypothetical protein JO256_08195, partial [Alphaproteobacteria bacterium]|nr:hypothetical protein [Alphaproteobacteria bacterium]